MIIYVLMPDFENYRTAIFKANNFRNAQNQKFSLMSQSNEIQ
jgi:hypothetical protein